MSSNTGQVISEIQGVPATFSSWDACMTKAYCKWPAIAGIVIGSLIALSIIWCIASCLCCGATLCASCVRCLTCFGCCGMCKSGGGGGSDRKQRQDDYARMPPTPYNGYQAPPANMSYTQPAAAQTQFATFEDSKRARANEDSLPSMPTWASATSHRVEDTSMQPARGHGDDVEMGRMAASPPLQHRGGPIGGAYSSVPAASPLNSPLPHNNPGYFASNTAPAHAYQSDLGAQRMLHDDHQYNNHYDDDHNNNYQNDNYGHNNYQNNRYDDGFQNVPMSPAPTYTSELPAHMVGAAATTGRYTSPPPHHAQGRYTSPPPQSQQDRYASPPLQHPNSVDRYVSPPPVVRTPMPEPEHYNGRQAHQQYSPPRARGGQPQSPAYEVSDPDYHDSTYNSYSGTQSQSHSQPSNRYSYESSPVLPQSSGNGQGARPPSLLQVGRKAAPNTRREI